MANSPNQSSRAPPSGCSPEQPTEWCPPSTGAGPPNPPHLRPVLRLQRTNDGRGPPAPVEFALFLRSQRALGPFRRSRETRAQRPRWAPRPFSGANMSSPSSPASPRPVRGGANFLFYTTMRASPPARKAGGIQEGRFWKRVLSARQGTVCTAGHLARCGRDHPRGLALVCPQPHPTPFPSLSFPKTLGAGSWRWPRPRPGTPEHLGAQGAPPSITPGRAVGGPPPWERLSL